MEAQDPRKPKQSSPEISLPEIELGDDGLIDLGELDSSSEGSSIPMAELPEPPSGQSLTSWTEVIRRQRAAQEAVKVAEAVEVDAESDKDLLNKFSNIGYPVESPSDAKRSGDTSEIPQAEIPVFTSRPPSESDIDIGRLPSRSGATGSEVGFDISFPPSDAGGAMPIPRQPMSGVDFRAQAAEPVDDDAEIPFAVAPGTGMSGVDLGASVGDSEPGRSSILDVLLQGTAPQADSDPEQIYDFGEPPAMPVRSPKITLGPPHRKESVATQPGIDLSDEPAIPNESDSFQELTGPDSGFGAESAVDIYAQGGAPPSLTDSGTLEISEEAIEESQRKVDLQNSSSIDLDSRPSSAGSDFGEGIEESFGSRRGSSSDSDINLDLPPIEDEGSSSVIASRDRFDANEAAIAAEFRARKQRSRHEDSGQNVISPSGRDEPERKRRGYLLHGGVLGLLLGAGSVLAAYFGGALPDRKKDNTPAASDNTGQLAQLRDESLAAQKQAAESKTSLETLRKSLADAGVDADKPAATVAALKMANEDQVTKLTADLTAAKNNLTVAQKGETDAKAEAQVAKKGLADVEKMATDAKAEAQVAKKGLADAEKIASDAKKLLADAVKAEETAKAETVAAKKAQDAAKAETVATKKAADDAMAAVSKSLTTAGVDPAKLDESLKKLVDARSVAETKEKETAAKLSEATKKEADLVKVVEATKKQADDASKLRDASEATVKGIVDRLAKAKFVGDKPDSAAVLKGLDEAIKSVSTDTTVAMREELVKARAAEAKMKADLLVAKDRETEASKLAAAAQAEAKKTQDALKVAETKSVLDAAKFKADNDKLVKEATDSRSKAELAQSETATAKTNADRFAAEAKKTQEALKAAETKAATDATNFKTNAEKLSKAADAAKLKELAASIEAESAKADADKLAVEASRLKTLNERLSRDLEAVRELADLLKAQPSSVASAAKLDPVKLGERFFTDGMRSYFAGRHAEAETAFRKAIQFKPDDARYHYLHGLSLWMIDNTKEAELAFEKGRDLEREARPPSRVVSAVLERVQGQARQAVNAYRP